jgi:intermembrane space import and assembly protein 40
VEEKRQREAQRIAEESKKDLAAKVAVVGEEEAAEEEGAMGGLEEEADQQGAFNPETGEINWDCPCLGGMAHGPCGEEFKAAFSCFVYSNEEPKGVECIEKFK